MFPYNKAALTAYLIVLSLTLSSGVEVRNASIIVFGRSDSDVSSTVRMLLGSFAPETTASDSYNSFGREFLITEFVVPIPGDSASFLKIVEVQGMTDGRHPEDDDYAQASLKTYLTHPEGLNSQRPTAVLIVSPFDDFRYDGPQSSYVEMLRRIADVEKSVYGNEIPDMNILLFTRLMDVVKPTQLSPWRKLASLKSTAIKHVSGISPNIATLVGENKCKDCGLKLNEDGTYRLPNRQFYPTNVFEAVANLPDDGGSNSESVVEVFTTLRSNSKSDDNVKASRVLFTVTPHSSDVDFFRSTHNRRDVDGNGMGVFMCGGPRSEYLQK